MRNVFCFLVFIILVSISCHSSAKKGILVSDSMKVVMWDMMKADELYIRILGKDSTASIRKENIRMYEEVLLLHKTTKGQFDSSYKYYEAHPVEFKLLIDSLESYGAREKLQLNLHGQGGN